MWCNAAVFPAASPATMTPDLLQAFAPTGRLRACINLGNAVLAGQKPDGEVYGVSVDLARGFAQRLGVEVELIVVDGAAKSVDRVAQGQADIGFFAIDPKRGEGVHFTAAYVLIEGCYLVRDDSPLQDNAEVDRAGTRLVVAQGSAYDLFLSREIQHATLERAATAQAVVEHFLAQGADVAAGVKQQLEADMAQRKGLRLLPGRFMVIQQAMGCPRARGQAAAEALAAYVEEMKASGFVAEALARHGIAGASVAPAASA